MTALVGNFGCFYLVSQELSVIEWDTWSRKT